MKELFNTIDVKGSKLSVSNFGRVFKEGVEVNQNENHDGYLVVYVGGNRSVGVHRLVALAFIPNTNPEHKDEVNHIDFDRKNNKASNLEWMSHKENIRYSKDNGRYVGRTGKDNPNYGTSTYIINITLAKIKRLLD